MANKRGQQVDTTQLSDHDIVHGFMNRDRYAHQSRYWYAMKACIRASNRLGRPVRLLDAGAGRKPHLPEFIWRNMYSSVIERYWSYDVKAPDWEPVCTWQFKPSAALMPIESIVDDFADASDAVLGDIRPDVVCMFEVFEHVEPEHGLRLLERLKRCAESGAVVLFSTPVWAYGEAAAANHVSEASFAPLNAVIEANFEIFDVFGSFGRVWRKKNRLSAEARSVIELIRDRVSPSFLAVVLAATMDPADASNCVWSLGRKLEATPPDIACALLCEALDGMEAPWTSSERWRELLPGYGHPLLDTREPLWTEAV